MKLIRKSAPGFQMITSLFFIKSHQTFRYLKCNTKCFSRQYRIQLLKTHPLQYQHTHTVAVSRGSIRTSHSTTGVFLSLPFITFRSSKYGRVVQVEEAAGEGEETRLKHTDPPHWGHDNTQANVQVSFPFSLGALLAITHSLLSL